MIKTGFFNVTCKSIFRGAHLMEIKQNILSGEKHCE
jgi:hypothetical protein